MEPVSIFSPAYIVTLVTMAVVSASLCVGARRSPGQWVVWVNKVLAGILVAVTLAWIGTTTTAPHWSSTTSLPLALCDLVAVVAAAGLWWRQPTLVELTYFWGLAAALQALLTPDVQATFPSLEFLEYVVGHVGIVVAALFLVVGQRLYPRRYAAARVLAITVAYTGFVGLIDAFTGADYMYLRQPPSSVTLLRFLGPWPWYLGSMLGVAIVLLLLLDLPFLRVRRRADPVESSRGRPSHSAIGVRHAEPGGERTLPRPPRSTAGQRQAS
jgi:hypothetical integral membrane protein (TIGR02206 family)